MWYKEEGHDYYKREPKKPKHMRGLTRLDYYVLMRIQLEVENRGHEECQWGENQFHLINCMKYVVNRPQQERVFYDRKINE